jgi:iron uptake system component EfeO
VADPASPAAAIADPGTVRIAMRKDSCAVSAATFPSGSRTFTVDNQGGAVGEVYVYASDGTKVGEVENVGPGTRRDLTVTLAAGAYQVACKPASVGKGIGTTITVTG